MAFKADFASQALLSARDFHQIAGRAGRRGFDDQGSVCAVPPAHEVFNAKLKEEMSAANKKENASRRDDFDGFSMIFDDFHGFSMIFRPLKSCRGGFPAFLIMFS